MRTVKLNPAHVAVIYKGEVMPDVISCTVILDDIETPEGIVQDLARMYELDPMLLELAGAQAQWFDIREKLTGDEWCSRFSKLMHWCDTQYPDDNPYMVACRFLSARLKQLGYIADYNLGGAQNPQWTKISR